MYESLHVRFLYYELTVTDLQTITMESVLLISLFLDELQDGQGILDELGPSDRTSEQSVNLWIYRTQTINIDKRCMNQWNYRNK